MDELPRNLQALVNAARAAHDPRPEDARRVAIALSAVVTAFPASATIASSTLGSAGSGVGSSIGSSVGGSVGGSVAASGALAGLGKAIGVAVVVAGMGAAVTIRSASPQHRAPVRSTVTASAPPAPTPAPAPAQAAPALVPTALPPPAAEPPIVLAPIVRRPAALGPRVPQLPVANPSDELPLIQAATQALRDRRADLAQQLLAQHAARFPEGALKQERAGLTVLALCQQGRAAEAAPLRDRFLAETPDSPLAGRVRRACAGRPQQPPPPQ